MIYKTQIRLYSWLRFITAKGAEQKEPEKRYALDRIQRDQMQAFKSFPIKGHIKCAFSLAEYMCRMSPLRGVDSSLRVQGINGGLVAQAHSST